MNNNDFKIYCQACKTIFKHYGEENQRIQLIQELAELIVALTKNDTENIIEEMADVEVMIDQFILSKGWYDRIEEIQTEKITRQLKRIEAEND